MNHAIQRIAIAKACGWKHLPKDPEMIQYTAENPEGKWGMIPDYYNDLNAILGAVRELLPKQKEKVVNIIGWSATRQVLDASFIANATAAQWATAYLKATAILDSDYATAQATPDYGTKNL